MLWQTTGDVTEAETSGGRDACVLAVAVPPSADCCQRRHVRVFLCVWRWGQEVRGERGPGHFLHLLQPE